MSNTFLAASVNEAEAASQYGCGFSFIPGTSKLEHWPLDVWPLHSSYAMSLGILCTGHCDGKPMGQIGLNLLVTLLPKWVFYGKSVNASNNQRQRIHCGSKWSLPHYDPFQVINLLCHALMLNVLAFYTCWVGSVCWSQKSVTH